MHLNHSKIYCQKLVTDRRRGLPNKEEFRITHTIFDLKTLFRFTQIGSAFEETDFCASVS